MKQIDIETDILTKLIRKYEKNYFNPKVKKHNKITLRMSSYAPYDRYNEKNTLQYKKVNEILFGLEKLEWITYMKEQTNENYIDKVILNIDKVHEIYEKLGIQGKQETMQRILMMLEKYLEEDHTSWCINFIQEEYNLLKTTGKMDLLSLDPDEVWDVLKMLSIVDRKEDMLLNTFSGLVFQDTKYFRKKRYSLLCRILLKWNPEVAQREVEYGRKLTKTEILKTIGLLNYPEIFAFRGNVKGVYDTGIVDYSLLQPCTYLHSENIKLLRKLDCDAIKRVLIIENKANFYAYLNENDDLHELVIFGSGHYGFNQALLFELIQQAISKDTTVKLWSDIDYGGFTMFHRLQKDIFPQLQPYRMDLQTYETYLSSGMDMDDAYCEKLQNLLSLHGYDMFHDVIKSMLSHRKRIEQELELLSVNAYEEIMIHG